MKKAYLIVFNTSFAQRDVLTRTLDVCNTILTWRYDLTNAVYVISEHSAHEIAKELEQHLGPKGRYIVLEYTDNAQGRLTTESWYLLNNKQHMKQE